MQISDRFHLVHNLGSLLDRILTKEPPTKIKKETPKSKPENPSKPPASGEVGYAAKKREENALKKWELALKVKALRQEGLPYKRTGHKLNLHRTTAKKYEAMRGPPDTSRSPRSTAIHRFLPELEDQVKEGRKIDDIETSLRAKGYEGSYSAVRRKINNSSQRETVIYRKQAWRLFWRPLETLSQKEREVLNQVSSSVLEYIF